MRGCVLLCLACCVSLPAIAGSHTVPAAYIRAARAHQVPPAMLYALSLTESGTNLSIGRRPWPWTLNIAGTGKRYATRTAACDALTAALTHTRIIDVGISQLNVHWQQRLFGRDGRFADPCAALNPYANLDAAAAILYRCHQREAATWIAAAGCYHRPAGGAPAARYCAAFIRELERLRAAPVHVVTGRAPGAATTHTRSVAARPAAERTAEATPSRITWINPTHDRGSLHALD